MKKFWQEVIRELKSFENALLQDTKVVSNELPYSSIELRNAHYSILSCAKTLDEVQRNKKTTLLEGYINNIDYVLNYFNEILIHSEYSFVDGWKLPTGKIYDVNGIIVAQKFIKNLVKCFLFSSEFSPYPKVDLTSSALTVFIPSANGDKLFKFAPKCDVYVEKELMHIHELIKKYECVEYNCNFIIVIKEFDHFMWNIINAIRSTLWVPEHTVFESWGYLNLHLIKGVPKFIRPKQNIATLMNKLNTIK